MAGQFPGQAPPPAFFACLNRPLEPDGPLYPNSPLDPQSALSA